MTATHVSVRRDPVWIATRSSSDRTRRPARFWVDPIKLTIVARSTSDVPRQFRAMCEKSRCSIRFHLLVAGGTWHTVIVRPVRFANRCSSHFQRRRRVPLLPPASAVIGLVEADAVVCDGEAVDIPLNAAVVLIPREAWCRAFDFDLYAPLVWGATGLLNGMYRVDHSIEQRHQAIGRREGDIPHPAGQVGSDHRLLDCARNRRLLVDVSQAARPTGRLPDHDQTRRAIRSGACRTDASRTACGRADLRGGANGAGLFL